jgi:DNA-binding IclR family transcriptional regulator
MELLAEDFSEYSAAEIRKQTDIASDAVFRTLKTLHEAGWIERHGDRYRLSNRWPKIGYAFGEHLVEERNKAHQRLQEFRAGPGA